MRIDMPNFAPSDNRAGPLRLPFTLPEPSISECFAGVASNSKIAAGGAGTNCDTEMMRRTGSWAGELDAFDMALTLGERCGVCD